MGFVEDNQLIQALLPNGSNPAFGKGIRIGCAKRREQNINAFRFKHPIKPLGKLAIPVMNQKTNWKFSIRKRPHQLAGLLRHPSGGWLGRAT